MARIRVQMRWIDGGWGVYLPTYTLVPGTMTHGVGANGHKDGVLPDVLPNKAENDGVFVDVLVPDKLVSERTRRVDVTVVRETYANNPRFRALTDADLPNVDGR